MGDKYCLIASWMAKKYSLKGNSLIVYSILYATSQDDFSMVVDYDFIKLCTGLKPSQVDTILERFRKRRMIEFDGMYYRTLNNCYHE